MSLISMAADIVNRARLSAENAFSWLDDSDHKAITIPDRSGNVVNTDSSILYCSKYRPLVRTDMVDEFLKYFYTTRTFASIDYGEFAGLDVVLFILDKETYKKEDPEQDSKTCYVNELNGTFRGLGQFNRPTWRSLTDQKFENGVGIPKDALINLIKLTASNARVAKNQGFDIDALWSPQMAYLYHNQGAGGAKAYLVSGTLRNPQQSKAALVAFDEAKGYYDEANETSSIS